MRQVPYGGDNGVANQWMFEYLVVFFFVGIDLYMHFLRVVNKDMLYMYVIKCSSSSTAFIELVNRPM